jgi:gliding motility-associated-like protein
VVSPNNDDKNDTFYILGLEKYDNVELHVYNRWGKLMFETTNYANNLSMSGYEDGVYFYTMILPYGNQREFEGNIHVMR